jgi:transposase
MAPLRKYSDEVRARGVEMWLAASHPKPPIWWLAKQLGVHPEALRIWIRAYEAIEAIEAKERRQQQKEEPG